MDNIQEIQPNNETPKNTEGDDNLFIKSIDGFAKNYGRLLAVLLLLSGILTLTFFITKGKKNETYDESVSTLIEAKNCLNGDDEIYGSVFLNDNVVKGVVIKLTLRNKFTHKDLTLSNEIKEKDGTFKFHICKETTEFVEFETRLFGAEEPKINHYEATNIPEKVNLNP